MKLTKTLAALCVLGAGLLAFTACKDSSGDIDTSGNKYALSMIVDGTSGFAVGGKAIDDSNEGTEVEIVADTSSKATNEISQCRKRAFKEISAGFNNTEGFRTNIVLDTVNGKWLNSDTGKTAGAGMLFDFNQQDDKTYDFFLLLFKPTFSGSEFTGVKCFFERYSGVKKYGEGVYSGSANAKALGSNYIPTNTTGSWNSTLFTPSDDKTWDKDLTRNSDYIVEDGKIIIGVDVKQLTKGVYTVRIGKISYTLDDQSQTFSPTGFNKAWKTNFTGGTTMGKGGETEDASSIEGYTKWTHVKKNDKTTNLKGGVLVYGFAPYGTIVSAGYYTCNTGLSSNTADNVDSRYDYVGDWNVANELDTGDGLKTSVVYEEGGVVHEYVEY